MFYLGSDKPGRPVVDHSRNEGYPEHIHDNLELIYITAGTRKCNIDGREYTEPTGSLTVIFSFQPHSFPDSPDAEYYWIGVNPIFMPELRGLLFEYRQYRTILSAQMRQQIFRQAIQKFAGRVPPLPRIFVTYGGKDASRCVLKASVVNCAVLPIAPELRS